MTRRIKRWYPPYFREGRPVAYWSNGYKRGTETRPITEMPNIVDSVIATDLENDMAYRISNVSRDKSFEEGKKEQEEKDRELMSLNPGMTMREAATLRDDLTRDYFLRRTTMLETKQNDLIDSPAIGDLKPENISNKMPTPLFKRYLRKEE